MPGPFLKLLPKSARQAWPIITGGVAQGLSSRAITEQIVKAGMRISRGRSVLPAMRAIRQAETQGRNVKFIAPQNKVNTRRLPPANVQLKTQYRYRLAVQGINAAGEVEEGYVYFSTDDANLTPQMIQDRAAEAYRMNRENYELDNVQMSLEYGEQRGDLLDFTATPGGRFER